ncbi:hypothetical protein BU15DRAFT_61421 [Melanogaster broomeanus]|nr:hypothetical protein BU15DRAFT_61421 [Melanogaster broomeanus]
MESPPFPPEELPGLVLAQSKPSDSCSLWVYKISPDTIVKVRQVAVHPRGTSGYLIMEYIDGETLKSAWDRLTLFSKLYIALDATQLCLPSYVTCGGRDGKLYILDWQESGFYPAWFEYVGMRSDKHFSSRLWDLLVPWISHTVFPLARTRTKTQDTLEEICDSPVHAPGKVEPFAKPKERRDILPNLTYGCWRR